MNSIYITILKKVLLLKSKYNFLILDEKHTDGTDDNSNLGKINKTDLTKEQEAYLGFDSKKSDGDVKLPPYAMATHPVSKFCV